MGTEIERKYLVRGTGWKADAEGIRIRQGYICRGSGVTVRVRTCGDSRGYLTVKGPGKGIVRPEFEYEIPFGDAVEMLAELCGKPLIEKDRYRIRYGELVWEIDEFHGENSGLVVAEVELAHQGQAVALPDWIDREVSGDPRYFNASLVQFPYAKWND